MARQAALTDFHPRPTAVDWDRMAARARSMRRAEAVALYAFLIAVSLPIILPYFWLVTIAFSAKAGVAETMVLWRSMLVLVPGVIAFWLAAMVARNRREAWLGMGAIALTAAIAFGLLVGPDLHLRNFIFLVEPDFASVVRSRVGAVRGAVQFPNVWHAFANSLLIAGAQTVSVVTVASLAAYYLSRWQFPSSSSESCVSQRRRGTTRHLLPAIRRPRSHLFAGQATMPNRDPHYLTRLGNPRDVGLKNGRDHEQTCFLGCLCGHCNYSRSEDCSC
jgi:hypothetical protein